MVGSVLGGAYVVVTWWGAWIDGWEGWIVTVSGWLPWLVGCLVVYTLFWLVLLVGNLSKRLRIYLDDWQKTKRLRRLRPMIQDCLHDDAKIRTLMRRHVARLLLDLSILTPLTDKAGELVWNVFVVDKLLYVLDKEGKTIVREARKESREWMRLWLDLNQAKDD